MKKLTKSVDLIFSTHAGVTILFTPYVTYFTGKGET